MAVAVLITACTPADSQPTTSNPSDARDTSTTSAPADADPCASGGLAFTSEGLVAAVGTPESDATRISSIRWQPEATCERLLLEFATASGSPATGLGLTGVSVVSGTGIVRVTLPESVDATSVADLTADGTLASRVFVVRAPDGSLVVDIMTSDAVAVAARAFVQSSPAILIVDLVTAPDAPTTIGPSVSDVSVVTTPLPGPALYPLIIEGYARPSLRSVRLLVIEDEDIAIDRAIALDGATDAWQVVSARLDDGPSGVSTVFLGTADVNGRPAEGATVSVDLP